MSERMNIKPVMASILRSTRSNMGIAILMALCIIGCVVTALLPPLVLERGINLVTGGEPVPIVLAVIYLCLIILADLFESAQGAAIMIFGQKLTHGLRSDLCKKLNRLEAGYFASHDSGKTASVFVNDADTIDALYSDGIIGMIADSFKIISILAIIFTKSIGLGIILICVTPFLFLMTRIFQKNTLLAQKDNRKAIARVNNHIPETIRNIRMIHVFRKEKYMEEKYDSYISESYDAVNRSNFYDSIYSPIILVTQAAVVAIMMVCASRGSSMQQFFGLSVGSAVAVIAYVGKIFSPLESIGMEIQNIQSAVAGIKDINEFLLEEEMPETENKQISVSPENKKTVSENIASENKKSVFGNVAPENKEIVFDKVTFGYKPSFPVLKDYSFEARQGENVTFMGRTGAGKSTIFRLLTGLYRPQKGNINVAGRNPASIAPEDRRKLFGLVEQSFTVVSGTVRDQITLYDSSISDDAVLAALDTCLLTDTVNSMPNGLDTTMSDGLFSHGQLQLLAIARAVVTSPEILLLDEITANLDSETEAIVLQALKKAASGRTVLSISHRLADIMKDERIIEVG